MAFVRLQTMRSMRDVSEDFDVRADTCAALYKCYAYCGTRLQKCEPELVLISGVSFHSYETIALLLCVMLGIVTGAVMGYVIYKSVVLCATISSQAPTCSVLGSKAEPFPF